MHNVSIVLANDRPHFGATCWSAVKRRRGERTAAKGNTTLPYAESLRFAPFRNGRGSDVAPPSAPTHVGQVDG